MLKKNEIIRLEISGMTNEGNGVGKHEGIAVFVPFTVIGDVIECRIVKVCKTYCYGIIENIVSRSVERTKNDCPVYSRCIRPSHISCFFLPVPSFCAIRVGFFFILHNFFLNNH